MEISDVFRNLVKGLAISDEDLDKLGELEALKGATNLLKKRKIGIIYIEISIINSYNKQGSIHEIISFLNSHDFELFNIYKAIRKKGRLLEIDGMFVRKDLLAKFNH